MAQELTGRHVLIITLSAFGVIIAVNLAMAFLAIGSFPGVEVRNSYIASQTFDRDRKAQQTLGWAARADHDGANLVIRVVDAAGNPPVLRDLSATVGRPTHRRGDVTPALRAEGGVYRAPLPLAPGNWTIQVTAFAPDGTAFRQKLHLYVPDRGN
ncbi:nitrogen fixation protein FixH [Paracoccus subflavus]|uniref:Nitrogen fixation protein FixH n=1 Tax=Paracoccus subflavus TaxID=2528244 RepID=A0A4Q9G2X1_9RHOB|nr:FixH family protein [Paracoccus subflavus]TBN41191.1 nitrogen fixation protein FixH [Paracoccus subflavus]